MSLGEYYDLGGDDVYVHADDADRKVELHIVGGGAPVVAYRLTATEAEELAARIQRAAGRLTRRLGPD